MTNSEQNERKRLIIQQRVRDLIAANDMPSLSRTRMHRLTSACMHTLGDEGITDVDLWTLARLTNRGLFDRFTLQHTGD